MEPNRRATAPDQSLCLLSTSFAALYNANACADRYRHLAKALGGIATYGRNTPIPLTLILQTNGLDDALWALVAVLPDQTECRDRLARLFACDCTERALQRYIPHPDPRSIAVIDVARRFARAQATADELASAGDAAGDAAWEAAEAAEVAARVAARVAAEVAEVSAWVPAEVSARVSARIAAEVAEVSARVTARVTAETAEVAAAAVAARVAEQQWQARIFREYLTGVRRA